MIIRKTAAALGAGTAIALALTSCSSGGADDTAPTTTAAAEDSSGDQDSGLPPTPTEEELNEQLHAALDPDTPAEEKAELVTGLEDDPELLQTLSESVAEAEADGSLSDLAVTGPILPPTGDQLVVPFTATYDGEPQDGEATLMAVDGEWRLDGGFVCGMATNIGIESPACDAVAGG